MEEENLAKSIEVHVTDVHSAFTQVNDQNKDEETSLNMEFDQVDKQTEANCGYVLSIQELHDKIKLLESENVSLNDQLSFAGQRVEQDEEKLASLQQSLADILSEHKLLSGIKEAYDNLFIELENSNEKTKQLEQDLQSFASDASRFEQLYKDTSLQAEFQTRRAEELEKLLQVAELSANLANDQITSLRQEIHGLHQRIAEKEESEALVMSDLQIKVSEFEEIQLKLMEEVEIKESVQASFRLKEEQVLKLQEELAKVVDKSELLEGTVAELTEKLDQTKESLAMNSELEQKLKFLEQLNVESVAAEASAVQKNLELQDLLQSSMEEARSKLEATEKKNIELENQVALFEIKYADADRKLKEYSLEVSELETEKEQMNREAHALRIQASELELALGQSLAVRSELEVELNKFSEKCAEYESRANAIHERNLELEGLVRELESLLETRKSRIDDLEQDIETMEQKFRHSESTLQVLETEKEQSVIKILELESALSQSLVLKSELEAEVKELVNRCSEDERRANAINERNLELEELVLSYQSKLEESKRRVSEVEFSLEAQEIRINDLQQEIEALEQIRRHAETTAKENVDMVSALTAELQSATAFTEELRLKLEVVEQKNKDLENQLNFFKSVHDEDDRKIKEQSVEVSELNMNLREMETEKEQADYRLMELRTKFSELESALTQSSVLRSELEAELKIISGRCTEQERRADAAHGRNLELEDLVRSSHSRAEDSDRKVSELEFCLETEKSRIKDLEVQIETLMSKCVHTEAKSKENAEMVSALTIELEKSCLARSSLEISLEAVAENEKKLMESLNTITEEKRKSEEDLHELTGKLQDAENLLELLHNELIGTRGKLESVENDLKAAANMEIQLTAKMESAQVQLQQQERFLEEATVKTKELESLNINTELKFKELMEKFENKDLELKSLYEKLHILDRQIEAYEEIQSNLNESVNELTRKELELSEIAEYRKTELDRYLVKVQDQENIIQGLEDVQRELSCERESFQNKIASMMEEKKLLTEANVVAQNELERQLKLLAAQNSSLETRMKELEQVLLETEAQFKKEIAIMIEEKVVLSEANAVAQNEVQTLITQLEEKLIDYKESNEALEAELEILNFKATENCALQTRVKELEELLLATEAQFKKEVEYVDFGAASEVDLITARMEQHMPTVIDGKAPCDEIQQLEGELLEENNKVESVEESEDKHTLELVTKTENIILQGNQEKELEQKVQVIFTEKEDNPCELKDIPANIQKKKGARKSQSAEAQSPGNNIRVAFGVAIVSIVAAILAGKK